MKLLRTLILRPLRRDLLRTALTVLAVALGVAVVLAIDLAGDAATGSFRSSLKTLVGSTDLEVVANGGVDEQWMGRLASLPMDVRFAPVIETQAVIEGVGAVSLYGLDWVSMPDRGPAPRMDLSGDLDDAIVVSSALASRLKLHTGDHLRLVLNDERRKFRVAGIAREDNAEFVALDIAAAQKALHEYGKLDRIDVYVGPHEDFERVERRIRALLPASYMLQTPGTRSKENQRMLRAFRWNLLVLSYISLVVGAFLIYNTISVSVVRRRAEIGVLRALGTSRRGILWLFLGEALLFGLTGSIVGVFLGRALAEGMVGMIAVTVNSLYVSSTPAPIQLHPQEILIGILTGLTVALASAFGPAREAMDVPPTEAMGRGSHEHHVRLRWKRDLAWAALLGSLAFLASQARPVGGYPLGGYGAALLAVAAAAMAAPSVILAVNRLTRSMVRRVFGAEGLLAGRSLTASLSRSSVVIAALATAIAMMASVGIMVGSFRETVMVWLDSQLRADLYIRAATRTGADQHPALDAAVPPIVASIRGVEAVDVFRAMDFRYQGERATLGAGSADIVRRYGQLRFLAGEDRDAILRSLPGHDRAIVSEPFANKHGIHIGDRLELPLGERVIPVTVAGIYYEYSSSQGFVILDRSTLLKYLPNQPPTNLAVYVRPAQSQDAKDDLIRQVQRELQRRLAGYRVVIAPNSTLRREAIRIFDRTFAITYALEGVAIIVAMLGAANSLLALVLDRRRELAVLRYLGANTAQIRRMILMEAGFIGFLANLLGLTLGFVLSLLLIYVVNKQSFGWTIQFHPPAGLLAGALLLVWCVTVLAGLYPARVASRLNPIEMIHEE